jgi:hypothetical protein
LSFIKIYLRYDVLYRPNSKLFIKESGYNK